jgi:hypothetical protein
MDKSARNQQVKDRAAFEAEVAAELVRALAEATDGRMSVAHIEPEPANGRLDLELKLNAAGKSVVVAAEVLRVAYPRDVQEAVWKLS